MQSTTAKKLPGICYADLMRGETTHTVTEGPLEGLTIKFNPDFYTAKLEREMKDPSNIYNSIAQSIVDNVREWNLLIIEVDEETGEPIIDDETGEAKQIVAPITMEFLSNIGGQLLQDIHHQMFVGTRPNRQS